MVVSICIGYNKSKTVDGAVLKKVNKSPWPSFGSTNHHLARLRILVLLTLSAVKNSSFQKIRWETAAILKIEKNSPMNAVMANCYWKLLHLISDTTRVLLNVLAHVGLAHLSYYNSTLLKL